MDESEVAGGIFDRLDSCKDMLVSRGELQLLDVVMIHQPLDIDQSDNRVQQLFAEINLNHDNQMPRTSPPPPTTPPRSPTATFYQAVITP